MVLPVATSKSIEAKVVVLGRQAVGKSSVVLRFTKNEFHLSSISTIGASFSTKKLKFNHKGQLVGEDSKSKEKSRAKLQIWDTAGQERFRSMAPMYYRGADAAIIMYDITDLDSFKEVDTWIKELGHTVHCGKIDITIVGNKSDLSNERQVSFEMGKQFADERNANFIETSAKDNNGIDGLFESLSLRLIDTIKNDDDDDNNDEETVDLSCEEKLTRNSCPC